MFRLSVVFVLLSVGLFFSGCGKKDEEKVSLEGNWLLKMNQFDTERMENGQTRQMFFDTILVLVKLEADGDGYKATLLDESSAFPDAEVKSFTVTDDVVRIELGSEEHSANFEGPKTDGLIRGNLYFGKQRIEMAWLERTEWKEKIRRGLVRQPAPALPEHDEIFQAKNRFLAAHRFCKEHPKSPLAVQVYRSIAGALAGQDMDDAELKSFANGYLEAASLWGTRSRRRAELNLGWSMLAQGLLHEEALGYLEASLEGIPDELKQEFQGQVESGRKLAATVALHEEAVEVAGLVDKGKTAEAFEKLEAMHEQHPLDPAVTFHLADIARKDGRIKQAMRLYGEIAAYPLMESRIMGEKYWQDSEDRVLPRSYFLEMWVKEHGSEEGMTEYEENLYRDVIADIGKSLEPLNVADAGNRVQLVELFTGSKCQPCVAADVATTALENNTSKSNVIVLRWHQHFAGPDPLANPQCFERFRFLLPEGRQAATPSVYVNGQEVQGGMGGYLENAVDISPKITDAIQPHISDNTSVKIELAAQAENGHITATADVTGLDADTVDTEYIRLGLLLAEDSVDHKAGNGIRKHEMIVRWMFGGPEGLAMKDGKLSEAHRTSFDDIREYLTNHLNEVEENTNSNFKSRPMELESLTLVGYVQNTKTKDILQVAAVPVAGMKKPKKTDDPTQPLLPLPKFNPKKPTGPSLTGPALKGPSLVAPKKPAIAEKP